MSEEIFGFIVVPVKKTSTLKLVIENSKKNLIKCFQGKRGLPENSLLGGFLYRIKEISCAYRSPFRC